MKCANLYAPGDLRYEDIPMPRCEPDEVLVRVRCCGICGSDVPRVFTKGTYHFPTVIGHEFSGQVVHDPQGEWMGRKVAVFPLLPCFECESCRKGSYATCGHYDYYGSRRDGGMAEYIAVKRWNILLMPENLGYTEGAFCEPVAVARHAVKKLEIVPGEKMLISGAGPIGLIAGQWAKAFGAEQVYYFDIDPDKIALAEQMGFEAYKNQPDITCVLEGTGHPAALRSCLQAIAPGGKMVLMGNPSADMPMSQDTYWQILRKELLLKGTWNSSYNDWDNDWRESLTAMAEGTIQVKRLITHMFDLSECNRAFQMMRDRTEFFVKVMLTMGEETDDGK